MKKSIYILFVLLIISNLLNLKFLPTLAYDSTESFIALMAMLGLGFLYHRDSEFRHTPIVVMYTRYLKFVWITIGLSCITCYLFWGQTLTQSFICYRRLLSYLLFFSLLWAKPSFEEVIAGFKYFCYIFLSVAFCVWILHIPMTNAIFDSDANIEMNNAIPGTTILLFYFYCLLSKLGQDYRWKQLMFASCILVYFILNQNRSILFPCIFFYTYTLLFKVKVSMGVKSVIILAILSLFISYAYLLQGLIEETQNQANDMEYVRWLAIQYFLTEMSPNVLCHIFGNGIISNHTDPMLWSKLFSNMWNFNDVGWFGYYAFFGIAGIIAVFNIIVRIMLDKCTPSGIRMFLLHMLVPTIWCLWQPETITLFCLTIYIYVSSKTTKQVQKWLNV